MKVTHRAKLKIKIAKIAQNPYIFPIVTFFLFLIADEIKLLNKLL